MLILDLIPGWSGCRGASWLRRAVAALVAIGMVPKTVANPQGMTVSRGSATAVSSGSQLNITVSQNAFLNWQSFNIAPGETTTFLQPSSTSIVWNRINDVNPSQIWGNLNANGVVVLMNQSGFFFGPGSVVNAAGFVATTATTLPQFDLGGSWQFNGPPPAASIVNYGEIKVNSGGSAFLIAEKVENHGTLMAPDGTLGLYAGKEVLMSERPDGRGLSVQVRLPEGSVDNQGKLVADAGSILVHAQTVNQNGLLQANSVRQQNGVIELVASDSVDLGANSVIAATGDANSVSPGGQVTVKSDGTFADTAGSRISVAGGANGGDGGQVELSALSMAAIHSTVDGRALAGYAGGSLLIDPNNINIGAGGSGSVPASGTVLAGDSPTTLNLDVGSAFMGLANITLQAKQNITVQSGTAWDLAQSTGVSGGTHLLSLEAGGNITLQAGAMIQGGLGWSMTLEAGRDFSSADGLLPNVGNILFQPGSSVIAHDGAVSLRAGNNITLQSAGAWTLDHSPGATAPIGLFSAEAGNKITIQGATIEAGKGWSVSLAAGRDFSAPDAITPGVGSILFQTTGGLEANDGSVTLAAGQDVTVANGFVRTIGGGSIDVTAVAGDVNTGKSQNGFIFQATSAVSLNNYMTVDPNLGGISTAAGGNVSITAGGNIASYLPSNSDTRLRATDAGAGAFGSQPGNVTLNAGGDITGHYVLRNGVGVINAGVQVQDGQTTVVNPSADAGTSQANLALSLVKGGWTVNAPQDIFLQEVRNPNGIYNNLGFTGFLAAKHYFDYDPSDYVTLNAGDDVNLTGISGSTLPRRSGTFDQAIPAIYPPSLSINAGDGNTGAGNVLLADNIILFASPVGQLDINTVNPAHPSNPGLDTGSLKATQAGALVSIIMSDSASSQYKPDANPNADFGAADHAPNPIHLADTVPVRLDIAGNIGPSSVDDPTGGLLLVFPKHAETTVGGSMINSRFDIQNLHPSDVTTLQVAGDILNHNIFSSVTDPSTPDFSPFLHAVDPSLASLPGKFSYSGNQLTFRGNMSTTELNALEHLQVYVVDPVTGRPILDANNNPEITTVSILDPTIAQAIYDASQSVPANPDTGYTIGGPGSLAVTARNIDLGATTGIRSVGPADNSALARLGASGASISVGLAGNLDMFSTAIASFAGGKVDVTAGGYINVGTSVQTGDEVPRGIFTVGKSDVTVTAGGDINVNGSRIAAYDGGNVTVTSLQGSVNAGHGGQGSVEVEQVYVDPKTGQVLTYTPTIPGSGILATSFPVPLDPSIPASKNPPGNIVVNAPHGDIVASAGGIVQIALNGVSSKASITLDAGHNIDASGSGVIGNNISLQAGGAIKGLIVAQHDININAQQNVAVTAIGSGNVSVSSAGGSISGTIVGVGNVSVSGASVDAAMLSQGNVSANNANVGSSAAFTSANAAGATSQSTAANAEQQAKQTFAASGSSTDEDDLKKKRAPGPSPVITRRTGRVTVILPKS
jgi:filamentous hemagglutinin family protein